MNLLEGKNAIVVGGSGDIGIGIVDAFQLHGIDKVGVIDLFRPPEPYSKSDSVIFVRADLNYKSELTSAFSSLMAEFTEGIDILVNCAGIQIRHRSDEFPTADWDSILSVNLSSAFEAMKLAAKSMVPRGRGKIINVTSIMGDFGGKNIPAYSASKAGLSQLTKSFCNDLAEFGINVNSISPGYFKTKMNKTLLEDIGRVSEISSRIPQKRWGSPEDIGGAAVFLASNLSDYVNGATITVDGGYSGR